MGFLNDSDVEDLRPNFKVGKSSTVKVEKKMTEEIKKPQKIIYKEFKESEKVHMNKTVRDLEGFDDFSSDDYPYSINFYDFEVFMGDWMVVIINPVNKVMKIIVNDSLALEDYYKEHKKEIWCGYNSRNYDVFILKSILLGINPKKTNDEIILYGMKGNQIDDGFRKIKFYNFDIASKIIGLKQLEGFMGNDIRETTVPFDIDRLLTKDEILETAKYCIHDVEQTIEVFRKRKAEYDAQIDLIETFNLPLSMISFTQAQLTANIIDCERVYDRDDEFNIQFVDTLKLKKYEYVLDWFKDRKNRDYKKNFETNICGVPHVFGWGGIHGCPENPIHAKGKIFHVDVTSYYPSIMIEYDMLTRNCKNKYKFKEIYDKRVELKKAGKKKEQAPYKIILNSTYGICKDKYSSAHDPQMANNVCINGQLMLLDLLEHLEGYADIIQSNTDGIILQVKDNEESIQKMKDICQEWMDRTGMGLGFDEISEIYQKDVNNYIFRFTNGKLERKGAYVMELNPLSNDLPIVNKGVVDYLMNDVKPEDTVNNCNDLIMYQKIIKVSGLYKGGWHNNEFLSDKCFRVFASKDLNDTYIGKYKTVGSTIEKFGNTPNHCFIDNEDVKNKKIPEKLDKKWYVDLIKSRIESFGVSTDFEKLF